MIKLVWLNRGLNPGRSTQHTPGLTLESTEPRTFSTHWHSILTVIHNNLFDKLVLNTVGRAV